MKYKKDEIVLSPLLGKFCIVYATKEEPRKGNGTHPEVPTPPNEYILSPFSHMNDDGTLKYMGLYETVEEYIDEVSQKDYDGFIEAQLKLKNDKKE